jgi:hypothetical protein
MDPETAIRFARIFHRFVPLAQLRSAACIGHMLNGTPLTLEMKLYGYRMSVDLHRSAAYRLLFIEGERWIEDAPAIQRSVRAGMTVFDIGANIGYLSLLMSRLVGISGRVYAFEPDADNYASLKRAVEDNQIRQ